MNLAAIVLFFAQPQASEAPRERIEEIRLDASGQAGTVLTRPEFMGAEVSTYHFGDGLCRGYRVSDRTLNQLFAAMQRGGWVRIKAKEVSGGRTAMRCIQAVSFFANST